MLYAIEKADKIADLSFLEDFSGLQGGMPWAWKPVDLYADELIKPVMPGFIVVPTNCHPSFTLLRHGWSDKISWLKVISPKSC